MFQTQITCRGKHISRFLLRYVQHATLLTSWAPQRVFLVVTRDHPHAGVVLLGDFNQLRDAALLSYPLRQVVKSSTRGSSVLDKIYTSLKDWYEVPVVLPHIGRSDHNAVVMSPKQRSTDSGEDVMVVVRSQGPNSQTVWQCPKIYPKTCPKIILW